MEPCISSIPSYAITRRPIQPVLGVRATDSPASRRFAKVSSSVAVFDRAGAVGRLKGLNNHKAVGSVFRAANIIARQFTWPVVISVKHVSGKCSAGMGALVVINNEGWFVTAYHIVDQIEKLMTANGQVQAFIAQRAAIENNAALSSGQRKKQLAALGKLHKDAPEQFSIYYGRDGVQVANGGQFKSIPQIDIAVGKLEPFDPSWVSTYPTFKDPAKDYDPGQSLCKLGFPLHQLTPIYHDNPPRFELPPEALPLPFFPIDGILTRFANVVSPTVPGQPPPPPLPFPLMWIETSSPGLKGQSGGPTFDSKGTVWGIQVQTTSYALGFAQKTIPEQYLNVGLGVHAQTLIDFFNHEGIKFQLSAY